MIMRAWNRLWFTPESPYNLAGARIVIALHALWILLSRNLSGTSALPPVFWSAVPTTSQWRYAIVPGHPAVETALQVVVVLGLIAVALGLYARPAALVAALLLYHLAPLQTIIWSPSPYERGFEVTVLALVVLSISRSDDVWAVRPTARSPVTAAWEYRWPLVLVQLFVAQIYLFSGYAKLYRVGWHWMSAGTLRPWLLVLGQQDQIAVFHAPGQWLANHPTLTTLVAVGAVLFDLGFVFAVFWRRARWILVPAALLFHTAILFTMNILFLNAPQLLVFVDWGAVRRFGRAVRSAKRPWLLPSSPSR